MELRADAPEWQRQFVQRYEVECKARNGLWSDSVAELGACGAQVSFTAFWNTESFALVFARRSASKLLEEHPFLREVWMKRMIPLYTMLGHNGMPDQFAFRSWTNEEGVELLYVFRLLPPVRPRWMNFFYARPLKFSIWSIRYTVISMTPGTLKDKYNREALIEMSKTARASGVDDTSRVDG